MGRRARGKERDIRERALFELRLLNLAGYEWTGWSAIRDNDPRVSI